MNSSKRYNQILFLTTLSVYLGLVLAGGASPALAQAAMAKGFELKTELEAKDDLDKKPNDEEEIKRLTSVLDNYLDDSAEFIEELRELYKAGNFTPIYETFSLVESSGPLCGPEVKTNLREATFRQQIENQLLKPEIELLQNRLYSYGSLSDCLRGNKLGGKTTLDTDIEISYEGSDLKVKFSARKESPQKTKLLLEGLQIAYKEYEPDEDEPVEQALYENTKITSDNDQVFIITNLPRAGLDALLTVSK